MRQLVTTVEQDAAHALRIMNLTTRARRIICNSLILRSQRLTTKAPTIACGKTQDVAGINEPLAIQANFLAFEAIVEAARNTMNLSAIGEGICEVNAGPSDVPSNKGTHGHEHISEPNLTAAPAHPEAALALF